MEQLPILLEMSIPRFLWWLIEVANLMLWAFNASRFWGRFYQLRCSDEDCHGVALLSILSTGQALDHGIAVICLPRTAGSPIIEVSHVATNVLSMLLAIFIILWEVYPKLYTSLEMLIDFVVRIFDLPTRQKGAR